MPAVLPPILPPPPVPPGSAPQASRSIAFSQTPGHLPKCHHLYVHIQDKTPKHEVYKNSTRGRPHTNSSRNPLQRGWGRGQASTPTSYHPPAPPCHRVAGQPRQGDPAGHSSDTAKRRRGHGAGGPAEADRAPPNLRGHRRPVGRYGTGQTNTWLRDEAERGGLPWPPLPPQAGSQPQVGVRGIRPGWDHPMDEEGGQPGTPQARRMAAAGIGHRLQGMARPG